MTIKQIASFPFDSSLIDEMHELKIPGKQIKTLTKAGLIKDGLPLWQIEVTYYWTQLFPSHAIVHVEHEYRPFIASGTASGYSGRDETSFGDKGIASFCFSEQQLQTLDSIFTIKENLDNYGQVGGTIVEYVLTTANSWKDVIRDFTLRIHAKSKEEIIASCFPLKVNRVSDLVYEAHANNFKPKAELSVYFGNSSYLSNGIGEAPRFK